MPESTGPLTRSQRHQLLDLLEQIPDFDKPQGRDMLLEDLPDKLVASMDRAEAKARDLREIVMKALKWGPSDDGTPAIYTVIGNAVYCSRGSAVGQSLHNFYEELKSQSSALTTGGPALSPEMQEGQPKETIQTLEPQPNSDALTDLFQTLDAKDFAKAISIFHTAPRWYRETKSRVVVL